MTDRQRQYYSRRTFNTRVHQLIGQIKQHPKHAELLSLITDQVQDDTYRVKPQVFLA